MEISHSLWPWHRSDATALTGYANMMMMMMMDIRPAFKPVFSLVNFSRLVDFVVPVSKPAVTCMQ